MDTAPPEQLASIDVFRQVQNITPEHIAAMGSLAAEIGLRRRDLPKAERLDQLKVVLMGNGEFDGALETEDTWLEPDELVGLGAHIEERLPPSAMAIAPADTFPYHLRSTVSAQDRAYHSLYIAQNHIAIAEAATVQAIAAQYVLNITAASLPIPTVLTRGYLRLANTDHAWGATRLEAFAEQLYRRQLLPPVIELDRVVVDVKIG